MTKKVLIIDDMHESIVPMLSAEGYQADYLPEISRNEVLAIAHGYEVIIVRSKTVFDKELVDAATNLKVIARAGAGIDKLDVDYIQQKAIQIINAPEGNRDAVAEHTLGMLLALNHKLFQACSQVKNLIWDREANRGFEIKGKTIGVFGYGFMGQAFAQRLKGFECNVLAYDKFKSGFGSEYVQEVTLSELQKNTQILSIHVPFTDETKSLFNREFLKKFEKLEVLINTARGEIVVLDDLLDLLENKKLRGACLDVLENEKFNNLNDGQRNKILRLTKLQNVILSPHVAGWTYESYRRINTVIVEKLKSLNL
ncbi:MAG: NAD(P)-dependent oxidoreductase [Cyclobacteriaceae bacterium]